MSSIFVTYSNVVNNNLINPLTKEPSLMKDARDGTSYKSFIDSIFHEEGIYDPNCKLVEKGPF